MSKHKKLIFIILIIFILPVLFTASIPSFLSTELGKKIIIYIMNKKGYKNFSASNISLSWLGPQKIEELSANSDKMDLSANFFETDLPFLSFIKLNEDSFLSLKATTLVKNVSINFNYPNFPKVSISNTSGSINSLGKNNPLSISLSGQTILNNQEGFFDISSSINKNSIFGNVELLNFPTITIDELFSHFFKKKQGMLTEILGPITNLKSSFKIEDSTGPVDLLISSTHIQTHILANYQKNDFTLNSDLKASITLTETLSNYLLKDLNPLLINRIQGLNPIKITLFSEGFYLPINPFSLEKLTIKNAVIDIGKTKTTNGENIATLIGIMKYHSLSNVKEMTIWCTPFYISIENKILYASRMDALLADAIHICTWGFINLETEKVLMTLGLTSSALDKAFGIKNLPKNYVMQIPMKGKAGKIKIDKKTAATKIAALLAIEKVEGKNLFGQILGSSLKHLSDDQKNVPSPSFPIPWEK